jgi:two-component system NarL family sensor kinase
MTARSTPRTRDLRILNRVAEALNSAPDVQQALEKTLALVAELLGLRTGWVWLLDPESGQFYNAAARNLPPYLQEPVRMTGAPCWCMAEFREGQLTASNIHLIHCSRLYPAVKAGDTDAAGGLCCHASIPLSFGEKPLGIMNVTGPAWRELSPEELRLLSTIAYQVGIAVERARLAEDGARLARAEERARIAREIHDTLAQGLTAIALHLEGARDCMERDPALARERLERALATTRENLEEARRSVLDLRGAPLEGKPLEEALRALGRSLTSETGVRVYLSVEGDAARRLSRTMEAELFRIAQEALNNVRRHAGAAGVRVSLKRRGEGVRMVIRDDGEGFEGRRIPEAGQGIVGMRERARLLGGRLRLESRPGRGTTLTVEAPLPEEDAP